MQEGSVGVVGLFGAGGAIGHSLAPVLEGRGIAYRVVGRDPERMRREFPRAQASSADFLSGDGATEAANGIDTIVYLAGAPYTNFEQHPVMTGNALRAAREAGVKRFVHVAPVYSYGPAASAQVPESVAHEPTTKKGRFRLEQERLVLSADGQGMRTLVMHLPDFYGPHADNGFANYFMREAVAGKPATFIGPLDVKRDFAFVPDAAEPLLDLAGLDDAYGSCWNLGGFAPIAGNEACRHRLRRPRAPEARAGCVKNHVARRRSLRRNDARTG
ncbi:MAG TPA: NAD-dependent epimerase/dehydratase family protein [Candidatus Acidoferrales bacterium]|nr:NAD-dependent epimerase/dehydratase family protein [Candidatus Acidoferrales bacterium]